MSITLIELPFNYSDLEPFLSRQALLLHHGKHHAYYNDQLNDSIRGTRYSTMALEDIVTEADGAIYRNAAQVWNHNFFWKCLTSQNIEPLGAGLLAAIEGSFESFQDFKTEFETKALNHVGSGWTWLISNASGSLSVINTRNADTPIVDVNTTPLLTIDVWEHAYYNDYKDQRTKYLENFWSFVNWHFVERNLYTDMGK